MSLSNNHWRAEGYTERMTSKQWREILLNENDRIFYRGEARQLAARSLGSGVVEVYKKPLPTKSSEKGGE